MHAAAMSLVAMVVVGAQLGSVTARADVVSHLGHNQGYGSVLDVAASAEIAARVAEQTDLLVTAEATQTASNLTSQVALAGTGDALAKRQVVSTAQTVRHDITSYTVKAGDTLSNIATDFGITTETIKWANNIDDVASVRAGQTLKILPITGVLYTVKSGDTVASIAKKYQAVEAQITEYNDLDAKGLVAGREILVPEGRVQEVKKATVMSSAPVVGIASYRALGGGGNYPWGQCTYGVAEMIPGLPNSLGNAWQWRWTLPAYGWHYQTSPVPGSIAYTGYGWGGYGHVAYVTSVNGDGTVTIRERNFQGNPYPSSRTVSASSFGYLVRN